jgi:hypothetical protein
MTGLTLNFISSEGRRPVARGPFRQIRLEGEVMRPEAGAPVLAKHEDHAWLLDGERYARLECDSRVTLHMERVDGQKSKVYGPFESLSFVDGIAYANHEVFAFADRTIVDWYCHADDTHWPLLIITAV